MDSIIRIVGALSLWPIEVIMQMRIYALYKCSARVSNHPKNYYGRLY